MFLLKNSLDENQISLTVSSEMFSKLCYFIWKSAKAGFKIYIYIYEKKAQNFNFQWES